MKTLPRAPPSCNDVPCQQDTPRMGRGGHGVTQGGVGSALGGLSRSKATIYVRRGLVIGTKTSSVKKTPLASVLLAASWRGLAGAGSAHARHLHNHSTTQRASCACSTIRAADPEAEQHRCSCGLRFKIQEARSALSNASRRDGDLHNNQALGGRNEQGL